jgi:hypothetical protein
MPLRRRTGWTAAATAALRLAVLLSLAVGSRGTAPGEVVHALLHRGDHSQDAEVVRGLRCRARCSGSWSGRRAQAERRARHSRYRALPSAASRTVSG